MHRHECNKHNYLLNRYFFRIYSFVKNRVLQLLGLTSVGSDHSRLKLAALISVS
jgi:hypothetical protein